MLDFLKALWRGWKKVAHVIGVVNTTILLAVFYLVFLGFAKSISLLLKKDPLASKAGDLEGYWNIRKGFLAQKEAFLKPY